jgi:drug/metabolite transporter (DMT)-like permease
VTSRRLGYVSLALAILVWGTAYPIIGVAERYVSPVALAALRTLIGGAVLAAIARRLAANLKVFIAGLINIGAFLVLLNLAIALSSNPSLAAVMIYTQPLFTALATPFVMGRRVSGRQYSGVGVGMAGIALLVFADAAKLNLGILIGLLGGVLWSAGTLYYEKRVVPEGLDLVAATAFMSLSSTPLVLAFWPLGMYLKLTPLSVALIAYIVVVIQAVGWFSWFYGVKALGGVRAGSISMLTPIVAILSTAVMFREVPTPLEAIASAAVIAGALVVQLG